MQIYSIYMSYIFPRNDQLDCAYPPFHNVYPVTEPCRLRDCAMIATLVLAFFCGLHIGKAAMV